MKTHCAVALAVLILIALLPGTTRAQTVFSGAGTTAATAARDNFRAAIGGGTTAGANGSFGGTRREINWDAVQTNKWSGLGISGLVKEGKQAEFLLERSFPWHLIERIGVLGQGTAQQVANVIREAAYRPRVEIKRDWYY